MKEALRFIKENSGCVSGASTRCFYADIFRRRILELREAYAELPLDRFADAVDVPRSTVEDWLRARHPNSEEQENHTAEPTQTQELNSAQIQTIVAAKRRWRGNFTAFCEHVRHHLRIGFGRSMIARILYTYGEYRPSRRPGRTPDESVSRGSFETYFPGAQWVGDGMEVPVEINGVRYMFNLELDVDAHSGAIVGGSVRDEEDSRAVVEAFDDGVATTGCAPQGLLLDWRPSNHTEEVDAALGETLRMLSTKGRPQNKAHVEGAFGLFSQTAPPIVVRAHSGYELAKQLLELRVQTWARALNHRPRRDRNWRSRVDIYREEQPSATQIKEARRALEERCRKQDKVTETMTARSDPVVLRCIDEAFERLGLADPGGKIRLAAAGFPRDAVVDGIAIFEGKQTAGTLPDGADGRYLVGIIKNLTHVHESDAITQALIRERLAARDHMLSTLESQHHALQNAHPATTETLRAFVDHALAADRTVDRLFWIHAAGEHITAQPIPEHAALFRSAARRIHATFSVSRADRYNAERTLARQVWPTA